MTENEIKEICKRYNIDCWSLNPQTGLVDVDGTVDLSWLVLEKLPLDFGYIGGDFCCEQNNIVDRNVLPMVKHKIFCDKEVKWIF